ncbi:hypothetical protein CLV25_11022 [Acetobacteroides hydrogenigenes]|uniref:Uncharacterized protein n=1 Tax=Acetobacteroides hydrogenigenes TaxID=979970 RepID=A0A4R2EBD1_9BACT|nr:hypothetical protein CLV25_11022 [Acetobacteroides hydrogenigenes]
MVVSRWLVMPIAAISNPVKPALATTSAATDAWVYQISLGSCSTHPGLGNSCSKGFCDTALISPEWSKIIALELVVP